MSLAHWLRQEYGANYADDIESFAVSYTSKYMLELSVGFLEEIHVAGQVCMYVHVEYS